MKSAADWWRVRGSDIVNGRGEAVQMRGFCIGGWLNMENSITGYPGHESGQRRAVAQVLGEERAHFFFERFLDYFLTEADLHYIAGLGANVVRLALNYRHFESDAVPFEYKEEGFRRVDQVVGWARSHGLHVILDLHSVQGWQSPGWHCDNPGRQAHFWGQSTFETRAVELWRALAGRYSKEPAVAGFNLMNEPVASLAELPWLHRYYRRATEAIREVAPRHIILLDGNWYAQRCNELEPPFDDNTAYSYHFYPEPVLETGQYPAEIDGVRYGREWLEKMLHSRAAFMRRHGVPAWAGEFGMVLTGHDDEPRLHALADMLDVMNRAGHHWTLWHYKDIGPMGVVNIQPESEWMVRTEPVRSLKSALRCDPWIERHPTLIGRQLDRVVETVCAHVVDLPGDWKDLAENIYGAVCQETLSQMLLPAYAEQFRGMSEDQIDRMMQSFAFEKCKPREGMAAIVRDACR